MAHSAAVTVTSAAAVPAFIAREPEIDAALDGIRAAREDHFFASPDNVNWGHVTAIADHAELLKRIADALCREGEHSDGA